MRGLRDLWMGGVGSFGMEVDVLVILHNAHRQEMLLDTDQLVVGVFSKEDLP